jgi:hypothetical protein
MTANATIIMYMVSLCGVKSKLTTSNPARTPMPTAIAAKTIVYSVAVLRAQVTFPKIV